MTSATLARAVAAVGAVEVAPNRFAVPDPDTPGVQRRWGFIAGDDLNYDGTPNIFSHSCAYGLGQRDRLALQRHVWHDAIPAPAWWEPARRSIQRTVKNNGRSFEVETVTVDFATGKEVLV